MTDEEIIAVVTAHKEGKTIEVTSKSKLNWEITEYPCWNFDYWDYRVKPEPHYRPFENAEEVMEAIKEKGDWVRWKINGDWSLRILGYSSKRVDFTNYDNLEMSVAFEEYTFADGTPFGKLVEE